MLNGRYFEVDGANEEEALAIINGDSDCTSRPFKPEIKILDPNKFKRKDVLPDDEYCTWVEDFRNPPSWAVYFGLVERKNVRVGGQEFSTNFMSVDDGKKVIKKQEVRHTLIVRS